MLFFVNDYGEGAHPKVLKHLEETNLDQEPGYGFDRYCESARDKIRASCGKPDAQVEFLVGGTQCNLTVISTLLQSYEGVIAADTGHVNAHEAGAIEHAGHKVLALPDHDGKLAASDVRAYMERFYADENHDHCVCPGMVYISHPTELGTLYTLDELKALHSVCQSYDMPLYVDGARLAYGLAAEGTDVDLKGLSSNCDAFYIGGTKCGALCGEALVFPQMKQPHFLTQMKQKGALLAKGRLLGVQFEALFTDGLYLECGRHAMAMARRLKEGLAAKGYAFYIDSPTNQIFLILEDEQLKALEGKAAFSFWDRYDETHTVCRLATSWATRAEDVDQLMAMM